MSSRRVLVNDRKFSESGSVKIVDFGIPKIANAEVGEIQALTRTGEVFGSPYYMSPEQCNGDHVDHRTDKYSSTPWINSGMHNERVQVLPIIKP